MQGPPIVGIAEGVHGAMDDHSRDTEFFGLSPHIGDQCAVGVVGHTDVVDHHVIPLCVIGGFPARVLRQGDVEGHIGARGNTLADGPGLELVVVIDAWTGQQQCAQGRIGPGHGSDRIKAEREQQTGDWFPGDHVFPCGFRIVILCRLWSPPSVQ
jgi:hypothetical protein